MNRKITLSIFMVIVLVCSFQGVNHVAEAVTVPEDPALSDLFEASGNQFQALLNNVRHAYVKDLNFREIPLQ